MNSNDTIKSVTDSVPIPATSDATGNSSENFNPSSLENCCVDTDAFNQFLQCCFDPTHLNPQNITTTIDNNHNHNHTHNHHHNHNHNHSHSSCTNIGMPTANSVNLNLNLDLPTISQTPENENDSSTNESDSVKTHTGQALPQDIVNCCTPIDLNPYENTQDLLNSTQYKCQDPSHNHYNKPTTDLSEMVLLNNFFSACCNDSNMELDTLNNENLTTTEVGKHPLISPPISTVKKLNTDSTGIYPKALTTVDKVSSLRDSLKQSSKPQLGNNNGHHHHLLHLHHHNPEDASKSHTHDIIFHHHNANGCSHNGHSNHHHHLFFEDEINGQVIKHDFILPDCDVNSSLFTDLNNNSNNNLNDTIDSSNATNIPTSCTDFLTSSICNLDSIFNQTPDVKPDVKPDFLHSHCDSDCDHNHHHSSVNPPSQQLCHDSTCHMSNSNLKTHFLNQINHSHMHSHYHEDGDGSNDDYDHSHYHSHTHFDESEEKNLVKHENISESEFDTITTSNNNDPLICKWDDCNKEIDSENFNDHLFKDHLQFLPLSPGVYDGDYDEKANSAIKHSNMLLHCGWDHCDFTTSDIDKFLEHVPEHTDALKRKDAPLTAAASGSDESENDEDKEVHVCQWVDPETGETCGKYFEKTEDLTNHIITDHIKSGKSSYTCHWKGCTRCQKPFSQRQKIIRHLNTHTKHKPFECPICHKKFSLDLMLKQHMRIHTGEKPYKCHLCGKTFKTSSSLTIHLRIHSGDKPMVCNICGKRFNESSNLNKHMKIHFRKYRCELCLKSFDTETKFKRHQLMCKKKPNH